MTAPSPGATRGRPPRTAEQRADRRAELVTGAMDAIRELGPDASILEIAAGAGVSKPALYAEFGDKEGLVDAIAQRKGDEMDATIVERLEVLGDADIATLIEAMVGAAVDFADSDPHIFTTILRGLRNSEREYLDNPIRNRMQRRAMLLVTVIAQDAEDEEVILITNAFIGMLLTAVEAWQATKSIPKEMVIERIAAAIDATLKALSAQPLTGPSPQSN